MTRYQRMSFSTVIGLLLTMLFYTGSSQATTVAELHFADVVANAELVFEGRVSGVEARQTGPRMIKTLVTFEVLDVIKGQTSESELTLSFMGGRVGQRQLQIADMQVPAIGESGIYFVESLQKDLVHPLVGWSQGHFLINATKTQNSNPAVRTVQTAKGRPVSSLESKPLAAPVDAMPLLAPGAAARGVQISGASEPETALSVDAFKFRVRDMVREQEAGL